MAEVLLGVPPVGRERTCHPEARRQAGNPSTHHSVPLASPLPRI